MTPPGPQPPQQLDCQGLLCPVPIHLAAQQLARLEAGALLEVLCDDEAITQDLPSWCRLTGHLIVAYHREGSCHHYTVRKGEVGQQTSDIRHQ